MTIWVTADPHFGHARLLSILREDGQPLRPFPTVEAMDAALVARWNDRVAPGDPVYVLGDLGFSRPHLRTILPQLRGRLILVGGNHDRASADFYLRYVEDVRACAVVDGLLLTHFPVHPGSLTRYVANVHGHLHERPAPPGPYLNVSVEHTDYAPVALDALLAAHLTWQPCAVCGLGRVLHRTRAYGQPLGLAFADLWHPYTPAPTGV